MKQKTLIILLMIETLIIVLAVLWACFTFVNSKKTELLRETSLDGNYLLIIQELGTPDYIALIMYIGCFLLVAAVAQVPSTGGQQSSDQPKDIHQLLDTEDDYISGDELDESPVITEQSFDVDLNDWGEVRFVSYLPTYDTLWEDVSFVLTKNN